MNENTRQTEGAQMAEVMADTGAAHVAAPPHFAAGYPLRHSAGFRSGMRYPTTGGAIFANPREQRVSMTTEDG